jgi:hypothetical protein
MVDADTAVERETGRSRGRRFLASPTDGGRGRLVVPVPFDPDAEWGPKSRHPVTGTIDGHRVRGVVEDRDGIVGFVLGPAWSRDNALSSGPQVEVYLEPEGPQREDLADDVAQALAANPGAARFFDGLAQFYRRGYLRWVDATKRSPELRKERIAEMVRLLEAGTKDYRRR